MEKYEKSSATSYCLGTQSTFDLLLRRPLSAKRIYISPKQSRDETYTRLVNIAKSNRIPVIENNEKIFKALSGKDNVMVIGEFGKWTDEIDYSKNHLVLVNPSNMGNLGTIIRCAAAFGITNIAIIEPASDMFDPKVVRSTMGAIFSVKIQRFSSFDEYEAKTSKHCFFPFMLKAKTTLKEAIKAEPYSLIFGNEATGLPDVFLKKGTPLVIPNTSLVDSLNLDNAVAIGLYEFVNGK